MPSHRRLPRFRPLTVLLLLILLWPLTGTGLLTILFARAVVPAGTVYAIKARAAEYHVDNVEAVVNDAEDIQLDPESIDLAFLCDTYHHFECRHREA